MDMSKFDKSQGRVVLLFEIDIMRLFGVPEYDRDLWWEMHERTTLKSRTHKLSTEVVFQRKSGDASTFEEMSFCSKFIITVADTVLFVPDPIKLLVKLGRHDIVNFEHLEQYRISLIDLTGDYGNMIVARRLSKSVADRYKTTRDTTMLIEHLYLLIRDKEMFHSMYYTNPWDTLCYDVSLPDFD